MSGKSLAALVLGIASLALAGAALAQADPLKDAAVARIRDSFKVDGIALLDPHATHAAKMGVCAPSIFAGLKWCVSGTVEERKGAAAYIKTTGYNIDAESRIVYVISSRRSYPMKRDEFDGVIQAIGERFGTGAAVYAFRKKNEEAGEVNSLIAVWGGLRLVHLTDAEYAVVEGGGSLKRGHLVDHRFSLVASAKQRDPIYRIEGEAGFILHLTATSPDRADVIARAVYQPVFLPPPGKPAAESTNPLVTDSVRRSTIPQGERAAAEEQAKRMEAERALAAERLLREDAERKAAEEKAARDEAERKAADERRAFEEEKKRLEAERKVAEGRAASAEERARRADAEGKANEERRQKEEAERKVAEGKAASAEGRAASADERAKRAERERMSSEERRRSEEAERKSAEERAKRAEVERKALEERRRKEEVERKAAEERAKRAEAERKAVEERRQKEEADRKAAEERAKRAEDERKALEERRRKEEAERKVAEERAARAEERRAAEQKRAEAEAARKAAEEKARRTEAERAERQRSEEADRAGEEGRKTEDDRAAAERRAEGQRLSRERAERPESWHRLAAAAAKTAGAIWSFAETQDRVAEERTLRTQTIFGGPEHGGNGRLAVEVTFECTIIGRERRLRAVARGFDRRSGTSVAFRTEGEGAFGVRTRFRLDDQPPQDGLLFRERQDDMASILEIPMTSVDLGKKAPRASIWLRHYVAAVDFNLVSGTVAATITPYADNLRRVLEACAE